MPNNSTKAIEGPKSKELARINAFIAQAEAAAGKKATTSPRPSAPVSTGVEAPPLREGVSTRKRRWWFWPLIVAVIIGLIGGGIWIGTALASGDKDAPAAEQAKAWNMWDVQKVCNRDPKLLNIQAINGGRRWIDSPGLPVDSSSAIAARDNVYGNWCTDPVLASQAAVGVANTPWNGPDSQVFGDFVDFLKPYKVNPSVIVSTFVQPLLPSKAPADMTEDELKAYKEKLDPTWDMVDRLIALHNAMGLVPQIEAPKSTQNYHLVSKNAMMVGIPVSIEINPDQEDELPAVIFEAAEKGNECIKARWGYNVGDQRFERFPVSDCKAVNSPPANITPKPVPVEECKKDCTPNNPCKVNCGGTPQCKYDCGGGPCQINCGGNPPCQVNCGPTPCQINCIPNEGKTPYVPHDEGVLPAPTDRFEPVPVVPAQPYTPDIKPGAPSDPNPASPGGVHALPPGQSASDKPVQEQKPDVNRPVDNPAANAPVSGAPTGGTVGGAGSPDPEG